MIVISKKMNDNHDLQIRMTKKKKKKKSLQTDINSRNSNNLTFFLTRHEKRSAAEEECNALPMHSSTCRRAGAVCLSSALSPVSFRPPTGDSNIARFWGCFACKFIERSPIMASKLCFFFFGSNVQGQRVH